MKQHFKIFVLKNGDTKFYTIDHSTRTYLYDRNKTLRLLIPGNLEKNKIEQDLKTIAYTFWVLSLKNLVLSIRFDEPFQEKYQVFEINLKES